MTRRLTNLRSHRTNVKLRMASLPSRPRTFSIGLVETGSSNRSRRKVYRNVYSDLVGQAFHRSPYSQTKARHLLWRKRMASRLNQKRRRTGRGKGVLENLAIRFFLDLEEGRSLERTCLARIRSQGRSRRSRESRGRLAFQQSYSSARFLGRSLASRIVQ